MTTGFERDRDEFARGARAIVVLPDQGNASRDADARLAETAGLAAAIGVEVAEKIAYRVRQPKPATLIGSGQVEQLAAQVRMEDAQLVVFDASLTPVQQSNLEKVWNAKVIDRTGLILEIFGERAATAEGRLQVELAHLDYQAGRLVRSWTHLERQRGGFGFLGGPGETQIEADRRLIGDRITRLENELKKVQATRRLHRAGRQRVPYRVVALVGYTNAGKSTLFNRLTRADVQAVDMLFATLDPTLRALSLPHGGKAMLSDTVGFITRLPHDLVAAFRATLEATAEADLLLHVIDSASPGRERQIEAVDKVLAEIGADAVPQLRVYNKLDLTGVAPGVGRDEYGKLQSVYVSAQSGAGLELLRDALSEILVAERARGEAGIPDEDTSQPTALSA